MAYNKINWENGSVFKQGYVLIDGVKYNTVQPEYSGETPINADNLNHMDDGIELANRKDIITASRSAEFVINAGSTFITIPMTESLSIGNNLTLSNGGIVVGVGITKVVISAQIGLKGSNLTAGNKNFVIRVNGSDVSRMWIPLTAANSSMQLSSRLISVNEGDVITIAYYGAKNDTIQSGNTFNSLTVEAVEYE